MYQILEHTLVSVFVAAWRLIWQIKEQTCLFLTKNIASWKLSAVAKEYLDPFSKKAVKIAQMFTDMHQTEAFICTRQKYNNSVKDYSIIDKYNKNIKIIYNGATT